MMATPARSAGGTANAGSAGNLAFEHRHSVVMVLEITVRIRPIEADQAHMRMRWMEARATLIDPQIGGCRGQILSGTGSGLVAEFRTAADAVRCAIELQRDMPSINAATPNLPPIELRIGVSHGDIAVAERHGDGVAMASHLQESAEVGGIVIDAKVKEQIGEVPGITVEALGRVYVRSADTETEAFRVTAPRIGMQLPTRRSAPPRQSSLAVLPFGGGANGDSEEYFTDGIVENIVGALAGVPELLVMSRTATLNFRGAAADAKAAGRQLGVRYVVTGTAQRTGEHLSLAPSLMDIETDEILWANSYEVPTAELFQLQEDIAYRVVSALVPNLHRAELRRTAAKRPESMDAYDLVLQAMHRMYSLDRDEFAAARGLLERAMVMDPGYASAYVLLAEWHTLNLGQGYAVDENAALADLMRLATQAVELHGTDARALALLGHCKAWQFRDFDGALDLFEQAFAASPNSAFAWGWSSPTCSYLGDDATAVQHAEHALRLSPFGPHTYFYNSALGLAHYTSGNYDEAARWGRRAMTVNPRYASNLRFLAASLAGRGRLQDARAIGQALLALRPDFSVRRFAARSAFKDPARTALLAEHLQLAGLPE